MAVDQALVEPPIENHGIIGDLRTAALVGMDGCIDFWCYPHFDSPSIFAALLDRERGGAFSLAPALRGARQKQIYLPETNVLLSRFLSEEGVAEVSDFMPVLGDGTEGRLVRRAKTVRGEVRFRMSCGPRFDYGRAQHSVEDAPGGLRFVSHGPDGTTLRLHSRVPLRRVNGDAVAEFTLRAGESSSFVLEGDGHGDDSPAARLAYVAEAFKSTSDFWRHWSARTRYSGRWREAVRRSALTLKLLVSAPNGSIVAAPTFGLPERVGGTRNWDYRYTWIRDASFTLDALLHLGHFDEAAAFMRWIAARCHEAGRDGSLQVLYGIDGRHAIDEHELPHLRGYRGSAPVRIGNAAYRQRQLDIYGSLLRAVDLYDRSREPIAVDLWRALVRMLDWVCHNWDQEDEGIWEVRGGAQEFLYSRVMCWVALQRGLCLARRRSLPAPVGRWRATRDAIHERVFSDFWDPNRQTFVQARGGLDLDASSLLIPLVGFIGSTDPRWLSTLRAIEAELVRDSLVSRYRADTPVDGLAGEEGTFSMCTFWLVECIARAGDLSKARFWFEKMLGYANHLGLYSEELGREGQHLGNFPQAFSHLGLIGAARQLDRLLDARPERG